MRNRLIELLKTSNKAAILRKENPHFVTEETDEESIIADYLIKNGVILPPCKVGDKLYAISDSRIKECTCIDIQISNDIQVCAVFHCDYDCKGCPFNDWKTDFHTDESSCAGEYGDWYFTTADFGKTVFLSKEDAEKALKGGCDHE